MSYRKEQSLGYIICDDIEDNAKPKNKLDDWHITLNLSKAKDSFIALEGALNAINLLKTQKKNLEE